MRIDIGVVILLLAVAGAKEETRFSHHVFLDPEDKVLLLWTPEQDHIHFQVQVATTGYVGIGFSPNGGMAGSDVFIGWVGDDGGQVFGEDRHAIGNQEPLMDASQDFQVESGYQNDTHTVITFSRPWSTCDDDDYPLNDDTTRVIWAYGPQDPVANAVAYHGPTTRGTRSVFFRGMVIPDLSADLNNADAMSVEMKMNNQLIPDDRDTLYYCEVFKVPEGNDKMHMIGYEPIVQPGNEGYVHHIVLNYCKPPEGSTADEVFEKLLGQGIECANEMLDLPGEWEHCEMHSVAAWAVGSDGFFLPEQTGISIPPGSYYMMQMHYDNPGLHANVRDSSGLRLHLTPELREFDSGYLSVLAPLDFRLLVPPGQTDFMVASRCNSECTGLAIPEGGIQVYGGLLHAHLIGVKLRLRHIRDGQELPPILQDDHYDFNYQVFRTTNTTILPNDELLLECEYNTEKKNEFVFGGIGTRNEMCIVYLNYYPEIPIQVCSSHPPYGTLFASLGIEDLHPWGGDEYAVKDPENPKPAKDSLTMFLNTRIKAPEALNGTTLQEYLSDPAWRDSEVAKQVSQGLFFTPHHPLCMSQDNHFVDYMQLDEQKPFKALATVGPKC